MKTILIVDDSESILHFTAHCLNKAGYKTIMATNGQEAIAKIQENQPHAVITDWMMPKMGGLDICRKLKKNPSTAKIPVILCTIKNRDVDRFWAKKQGVTAYLTKPWTKCQLLNILEQAIGQLPEGA